MKQLCCVKIVTALHVFDWHLMQQIITSCICHFFYYLFKMSNCQFLGTCNIILKEFFRGLKFYSCSKKLPLQMNTLLRGQPVNNGTKWIN